jgi:hypothetical protein
MSVGYTTTCTLETPEELDFEIAYKVAYDIYVASKDIRETCEAYTKAFRKEERERFAGSIDEYNYTKRVQFFLDNDNAKAAEAMRSDYEAVWKPLSDAILNLFQAANRIRHAPAGTFKESASVIKAHKLNEEVQLGFRRDGVYISVYYIFGNIHTEVKKSH